MQTVNGLTSYHAANDVGLAYNAGLVASGAANVFQVPLTYTLAEMTYDFQNFFHPFVGTLIKQLNLTSVSGMLDTDFLTTCYHAYTSADYVPNPAVSVTLEPQNIDVALPGGPYAGYNWELLYHIPVMVAVHLSNNQRFAEAQKWFNLVFDPTNANGQYWRSFVFNGANPVQDIASLLELLSTPDSSLTKAQIQTKANVITGYNAILANPFDPFVVARTRPSAFQWYVVMKYLDNLIAWGDSLFLQDTIETLNEATLCYVLAANLLGPQPQPMPQPGATTPRNFLQLKQAGLDRMSNALVDLELQFPFNSAPPPGQNPGGSGIRAAHCSVSSVPCTFASRRTRPCSPIGIPLRTGCSRFAIARTSRASCNSCRCSIHRSIRACWCKPRRRVSTSAALSAASISRSGRSGRCC